MTDRDRLRVVAFYAFTIVGAYLVYLLFRPFLAPLAWAGVFAICGYPIQRRFERRFPPGRAALLTTACFALVIIVPVVGVASAFVGEASTALSDVPRRLAEVPSSVQEWIRGVLRFVPGGDALEPADVLENVAQRAATFVSERAGSVVENALLSLADLGIALFALFFLLRDGPALMTALRRGVPLESSTRERLFEQTATMVTASVRSTLIVAAAQGALCAISFWIVGLNAPVFWGVVTTLCCLLPLGGWVVWAPAAAWLALTGSMGRALLLAGLGAGIVSSVDNVLRPMLLSGRSELNGLLLLISLLGGLAAFGAVGLVVGPVLMAAAVALFDVFTSAPDAQRPEGDAAPVSDAVQTRRSA